MVQISCKELEASCEYVTVRDGKIYGCCLADKKNEMQMRIWDSATGKILEEHQVTGDIDPGDLGLFPVVKAFRADNNGLYYLWYGMSVPCAEVYEGGEEDV